MAKLTDDEVRAIVGQRFSEAQTYSASDLDGDRKRALDFYYGRPLGNEIDGRSQVVSKVMQDTVEWQMPSMMRVFTTKQAVQFDPVGPEDEELARQETEYVSHVLWKQNPGFIIIHDWIKDALMQRIGYVKYWWEDEEKITFPQYEGLTQDQAALVMAHYEEQGEVEVLEAEIHATAPGVPQLIDIKLKLTRAAGRACIERCPPEEVFVTADCKGQIKKAKAVFHLRRLTRSDLLEMGFERKVVEQVTDYAFTPSNVGQARDVLQEPEKVDEGVDWATREFSLLEGHVRFDYDGDGKAELRHLLLSGGPILINEEADEIPWCAWTPTRIPGKLEGLSTYDQTEDFQRIDTALTRGLLDNTYFSMNQRIIYNKNTVNVAMLQMNRPGGHVANDGPPAAGDVMPIPVNDVASRLLPVIGYMKEQRQERTGVGNMTTGVDADVLSQSTKGAFMEASGKQNQRIEAVARQFAEVGLTDLYSSLHRLLSKHQDWVTRFKLKNDWVEVNPTEWEERTNMTVSVGLGTAGREEVRANLGVMAQAQTQAAQVPGLIQPKNVYSLFRRFQVELGFENEDFITDPDSEDYQKWAAQAGQQPPDPYLEAERMKAATKQQEIASNDRNKAADRTAARDKWITELEVSAGVDLATAGIGAEVALARGNGPPGAGRAGAPQERPAPGSV
jgi:hypothetical protein